MNIDRSGFSMNVDDWFFIFLIACVVSCSCSQRRYPVTPSASKAQKAQQSQVQSNFP